MDSLLLIATLSLPVAAGAAMWRLGPRGGQVELFGARSTGAGIGLLALVALVFGLDALLWLLIPWYREHRP